MARSSLSRLWSDFLEDARTRLAHPEALAHLAVLGLLTGLAAGSVIVLFQFSVEGSQDAFLPEPGRDNFEALPWWLRLLLPLGGGLFIGLLFQWLARDGMVLGVTKVLERMNYHQGRMDWRGFFLQFIGAGAAIVSGHSVGREGPHVYLGAASGSLLGQWLGMPHNVLRTLVACGAAAGIAASFNTPLAGVIFSLEVIMMEYTLASFIPVILAAVSATFVSNLAFGSSPAFEVVETSIPLSQIPLFILLGFLAGSLSAGFNQMVEHGARLSRALPYWQRTTLAGLIVGLCALAAPQVMGIGYDTVKQALFGELALSLLLLILVMKLIATSSAIGLGIPGGMIGPVLFMGAVLGSAAGIAGNALPGPELDPALYALLGMGAMMGASLQAPLAALTAMMELTYSPGIIMPGMLTIVAASLTSKQIFGKDSLFISSLRANGMDYDTNPVLQAMRRVGVASIMNRRFARVKDTLSRVDAQQALADQPDWLVIDDQDGPAFLMPAVDLARLLEEDEQSEHLSLMEIPAQRYQLTPIHDLASLQEALETLKNSGAEAVYVQSASVPGIEHIKGILTQGRIESAYRL